MLQTRHLMLCQFQLSAQLQIAGFQMGDLYLLQVYLVHQFFVLLDKRGIVRVFACELLIDALAQHPRAHQVVELASYTATFFCSFDVLVLLNYLRHPVKL